MDRTDTQQFVACEDRAVPLDDEHVMISMPYVNPTPWRTPREDEEAGLAARIDRMATAFGDHAKVIFNFHAPPKDSTLDTCAMLDGTTDPPSQIVRGGQPVLYGAGSTAIRESIERLPADAGPPRPYPRVAGRGPPRANGLHQSGQRVRRGSPARLPDHDRRRQGHRLPDDGGIGRPTGSKRRSAAWSEEVRSRVRALM